MVDGIGLCCVVLLLLYHHVLCRYVYFCIACLDDGGTGRLCCQERDEGRKEGGKETHENSWRVESAGREGKEFLHKHIFFSLEIFFVFFFFLSLNVLNWGEWRLGDQKHTENGHKNRTYFFFVFFFFSIVESLRRVDSSLLMNDVQY